LKVVPAGFQWRKGGGGKDVSVPKEGASLQHAMALTPTIDVLLEELASLVWTRIPGSYQLSLVKKARKQVASGALRRLLLSRHCRTEWRRCPLARLQRR
jgi:hypothetical protein